MQTKEEQIGKTHGTYLEFWPLHRSITRWWRLQNTWNDDL